MCNKSDEFVDLVFQNNLDIVAISETWFKPDDNLVPHECTPAGYSLHHIPRPKKTGGGVALLFRSSLSVSMNNYNIDYLTFESLHAEITCNSRSVRLVNILEIRKKLFNIVEKLFHEPKTPVLPSANSDQDLTNAFSNIFVTKM